MGKLGSYSRQNSLATALREMGRIEKTIFILNYISNESLRRKIQKGLNKGEALDARFMVETWAARMIISHVSDEQMDTWKQLLIEMDSLLEIQPFPFETYTKLDMKFHQLLVQWASNQKVQDIYNSINPQVSLARVVYSTLFENSSKRHKDHHHMYEALKNRDLSALINALQQHNDSLKEDTTLHWNEQLHGPIDEQI